MAKPPTPHTAAAIDAAPGAGHPHAGVDAGGAMTGRSGGWRQWTEGLRLQVLLLFGWVAVAAIVVLAITEVRSGDALIASLERERGAAAQARLRALNTELGRQMLASAMDYATWEELAQNVRAPDPAWLVANFTGESLRALDMDGVVLVDATGHTVLAARREGADALDPAVLTAPPLAGADGIGQLPAPLARKLADTLPYRDVLHSGRGGAWMRYGERWIRLVAVPIIGRAGHDAPPAGVLTFVREMTPERRQRLGELVQVPFDLAPLERQPDGVRLDADAVWVSANLSDPVFGTQTAAVARLPLQLDQPIERVGRVLLMENAIALVVTLVLLVGLLEWRVLRRIGRLHDAVAESHEGRLSLPPASAAADELDGLAAQFGRVVDALQDSNRGWRQAAQADPLTGLANRSALLMALESRLHPGQRGPLALFLLDLDNFKAVNDLHGHASGDQLLIQIAEVLRLAAPDGCLVARLGGDEFALLDDRTDGAQARAESLLALLDSADLRLARDHRVRPAASVGYVLLAPEEPPLLPSEVLSRADIAMYAAKHAGGNIAKRFDPAMQAQIRDRLSLEQGLRDALAQRHLHAWLQPIVAADDHRLLRVEALARWSHPERGMVPTQRFIEIAETTGQTVALDLQVLRSALADMPRLLAKHPELQLSFNASTHSLLDPRFMDGVLAALDGMGLPGRTLVLEITETALATNEDGLAVVAMRARARGIEIALDDFGAGQSSLARLSRLRPDTLKLDGSFIRQLDDPAAGRIVRAVIMMAREFGASVTAECVETEAQREALRALGVQSLQGYLIGRPVPATSFLVGAQAWPAAGG